MALSVWQQLKLVQPCQQISLIPTKLPWSHAMLRILQLRGNNRFKFASLACSAVSHTFESYFQLNYKCRNILCKITLLTSLLREKRKQISIIYIAHPQGIWSRSWEKAVWEHNDKWSTAEMRARVRAQEGTGDLCQRNQSLMQGQCGKWWIYHLLFNYCVSLTQKLTFFWYLNNVHQLTQIRWFFWCQHNSLPEETLDLTVVTLKQEIPDFHGVSQTWNRMHDYTRFLFIKGGLEIKMEYLYPKIKNRSKNSFLQLFVKTQRRLRS